MKIDTTPDRKHLARARLAAEPTPEGSALRWPGLMIETHALTTARDWAASGAWGLILARHPSTGPGTGRGKSLALAWLYLELTRQGRRPLYVNAGDLNLLGGFDKSEAKEACAEMLAADVLIVDELGAEDQTVLPLLRHVLERRGGAERPTAMATNLDRTQVRERYGDRLASRLRDTGLDERGRTRWVVDVEGVDLRGSRVVPPLPSDEEIGRHVDAVQRAQLEAERREAGPIDIDIDAVTRDIRAGRPVEYRTLQGGGQSPLADVDAIVAESELAAARERLEQGERYPEEYAILGRHWLDRSGSTQYRTLRGGAMRSKMAAERRRKREAEERAASRRAAE